MTPSLYDWIGGIGALERLTAEFYRRVADDPVLSPVFAGMNPDHPAHVAAFDSITVIPTIEMWQRVNMGFAMKSWHWFMLAQPFDLPERLLGADPDFFLDWTVRNMVRRFDAVFLDLDGVHVE